jgi:UDP-N-acetylmuramoyl-L-alanyl-D-glutamate--2,6-diaminopimelate ligase
MKKLKQIVSFLGLKKKVEDIEVLDLEIDSRKIKEGSAFLALKGTRTNGLKYMRSAQEAGAAAILYQEKNPPSDEDLEGITIPVIKIPKDKKIGLLASWFYDNPSNKIGLIGITGTNGKSTITQLIAQWLSFGMDTKCAVLGTLGFGFLPDLQKSSNTTLDAVTLQKTLYQMVHQGAHYAALEVSSIGAVEGRIDGCTFSAAGYTNLTRDHLDYHKTMENYAEAKLNFLKRVPPKRIVLNVDNEQGIKYSEELHGCVAYSCKSDFFSSTNSLLFNRYVWIKSATYKAHSIVIEVESSYGSGKCEIGLLGGFNVENFACALTVLLNLGFPLDKLLSTASKLKPIKGRMECFTAEHKPHIVVDYAHTPDGVEQVLRGVREHHPDGDIWCVLGCGGDRDKGKRPIMAIKASVFADHAVFTSDNPRTEDPKAILDDMQNGVIAEAHNFVCIEDREKAIRYAFEHATEKDCVVIAGKGHEDYQIFKDKTIHFSDREIACKLLGVKCD